MALSDLLLFVGQVRRGGPIGAILPSGRALGRRMTEGVTPGGARSQRVLEVGAGTGVFTREIIRRLGPADTLVVVEINAAFCRTLREHLPEWTYPSGSPHVEIIEGDVLGYVPEAPFDHVVSSLPLNALPEALVGRIAEALAGLVAPGGALVFFEYAGFRAVRNHVRRARGVREPSAVEVVLGPYVVQTQHVLWNVPPATVRRVCPSGGDGRSVRHVLQVCNG